MPRLSSDVSVLGPATRVTGRVSGDGGLRVEGKLRGDIQISGDAEIAAGGNVEGNVAAASLDISGTLLGDVVASGAVAIRSGAVVRGDLRGSEISIDRVRFRPWFSRRGPRRQASLRPESKERVTAWQAR